MQNRNRVALVSFRSIGVAAARHPRAYVNVVAFITAVAIISLLVSTVPADRAYASLWLMPDLAGLAALATCFVLEYRRMSSNKEPVREGFKALSEHASCRRISQILMVSGLLCAMIDWIVWPTQCGWEYPLALGTGIWVGNALWQRFSKA
jgi:hypothetical protein